MDKRLRKSIVDFYMALEQTKDRSLAVQLLAEHVAIMVEMIEDLKKH